MENYKPYFENERIAKLLNGVKLQYDFYSSTNLSRNNKSFEDCIFLGIGTICSINSVFQNNNGKEPTRLYSFWRRKN